jgi:hypothetical protein
MLYFGRPEQLKVSVPVTVLDGVMKTVASVVDPSAVATEGTTPTKVGVLHALACVPEVDPFCSET